MRLQCQILSEDEKQRIHDASVRLLETVGVKFLSDRALELLARSGARIDRDSRIARIPGAMIDAALKTAPKSFTLGGRDPKRDVTLPTRSSGYTLDSGGVFMRDFRSGERRYATMRDNVDIVRVFQEMGHAAVVWPHSVPEGIPAHSASLRLLISTLETTTLHVQHELHEPAEVPLLADILSAVFGGEDAVRARHPYSVTYCTLAPLVHDGDMCDAYLDLVQLEAPILIYPMACTGATGPCSLYSNIVQANSEALSSLVLFQAARPGTPLVFGDASGSTNFATGGFLEGSPEMVLQTGARGEMARFYGLPNTQAGCLTDAKEPGAQAIMEKLITTLPLVLSGADLVQGPGALETSNMMCLEQIVVDEEIAALCGRLRDGVDSSAARDLTGDIAAVGPGGHFLMQESTLKACRGQEFLVPRLCDRHTYERWVELGRPEAYQQARKRVDEILGSPPRDPLPDDLRGRLESIALRADRDLAG